MSDDFEIGRVVAVDTAQVTVELNKDLRALTRSTYEGVQEVGRINSYIVIPVGAHKLVAMVTKVVITEEAEIKADRTMVTLPAARRIMKATLIGTIEGQSYTQGVSVFPVLDNPVLLPAQQDLDVIFDRPNRTIDPNRPGYCIAIGKSALFKDRQVYINPDIFFGKHAAILGSTGSGKSCTIAALLQTILRCDEVKRTHFIILDTNGEYKAAFQHQYRDDVVNKNEWRRYLYIPSDYNESNHLVIPYWFLNADDFTRLFRASPGVQRPVLLDALTSSRIEAKSSEAWRRLRDDIVHEGNSILALIRSRDARDARIIRQLCDQIELLLKDEDSNEALEGIRERYSVNKDELIDVFTQIREIARRGIQNEGGQYERYEPIGAIKRRQIEGFLQPLLGKLTRQVNQPSLLSQETTTADTPTYFDKNNFRHLYLEEALSRHEAAGGRARDNCATMLLRIYRLLEDKRFEFLFGPVYSQFPKVMHSLAAFIRDIIGLDSPMALNPPLTDEMNAPKGILPYYDRQRSAVGNHHVVIIDLSLLAAEVLENVTALIGRLILEFLQRLGEYGGSDSRGSLPVVLILEEAQNYIRERQNSADELISLEVFERIAREGRKYGLGLVISSQRPSELSRTVLSQCSSFIVHRLQNPEDLRYFEDIVPSIYSGLLDQLPALAPQTALILGECVRAPSLVRICDANPLPRSRDPKFYKYWISEKVPDIPVEDICLRWEGHEQAAASSDQDNKQVVVSLESDKVRT
ncbi:MAG: DUF87 domain-containing protein [Firmicutes bacterium]|nr:DUF87 domain-containing protein [Bacillota bacterium]